MATGSIQTVMVCTPSAFTQSPCPSGMAIVTMKAYVIDPSQSSNIEAQNAPFDYGYAASIWGVGFSSVVGLYLVSKSAGTILSLIRRG